MPGGRACREERIRGPENRVGGEIMIVLIWRKLVVIVKPVFSLSLFDTNSFVKFEISPPNLAISLIKFDDID